MADEAQYEIVREESEAYMNSISVQQQWSGTEASFQILTLPTPWAEPLPAYSDRPDFLEPAHCRLCFEPVDDDELEAHLRDKHQLTYRDYRSDVLGRTLTEWPQPISPQILRSRLAAFKEELCDVNFSCMLARRALARKDAASCSASLFHRGMPPARLRG